MNTELLLAHWSGTVPPGFVPPRDRPDALPTCAQRRCKCKVAIKPNGQPAKSC